MDTDSKGFTHQMLNTSGAIAGPTEKPFKKIEVRNLPEGQGVWSPIAFEDLRKGDVFRIIEPKPVGEGDHPWVCLEDASGFVDEPGNFGVKCMPEEFSVGFELPAAAEGFAGDAESVRMLEQMRADLAAMPDETQKKITGHAAVFRDYLRWTGTTAEMGLALVGAELGANVKVPPPAETPLMLAETPELARTAIGHGTNGNGVARGQGGEILGGGGAGAAVGPLAAEGVSLNWSDPALFQTGCMDSNVEFRVDPSAPVHSKRVRFSFGERKVEFELLGVECYERVLEIVEELAQIKPLEGDEWIKGEEDWLKRLVDDAAVALPMLKREVPSA